jgi:peptidoglycan hydrolase-like protein with peptidoglycan-binding domain
MVGAALAVAIFTSPALGQQRLLLPEGTVLTVTIDAALSSRTALEGATISTRLTDSVRVEGYTVIPAGSIIHGIVTDVRPATRQQSGVIGLEFNQLTPRGGTPVAIDGKLTSTDPAERRQIDAQGNSRVVLVGGRRGAGAAVGAIGAGQPDDPISGILGALGGMLSEGADVQIPAGTTLAVQLERGVVLSGSGRPTTESEGDAFTIYTSPEMIGAAQDALRAGGYYRGTTDGELSDATQRALVAFQIDNGILVTGNLDGRTAGELGLTLGGPAGLGADEAALLRRNAQTATARYREALQISAAGQLGTRRVYDARELELYYALSAFTDNAGLYEQTVRLSGNAVGVQAAGEALLRAADRVDEARAAVQVPSRVAAPWGTVQDLLVALDPTY